MWMQPGKNRCGHGNGNAVLMKHVGFQMSLPCAWLDDNLITMEGNSLTGTHVECGPSRGEGAVLFIELTPGMMGATQ
jgi:hypothetical protein